jgi:hypothetical protein
MNVYITAKKLFIDKQKATGGDMNKKFFIENYKKLNSILDAVDDDKFATKERLNMFEKMVQVAELDGGHDLGMKEFQVRRAVDDSKWWSGDDSSCEWVAVMGPGPVVLDDVKMAGKILYIGEDVTGFIENELGSWPLGLRHVLFHPKSECKIIPARCFYEQESLISVNLPIGLQIIWERAFEKCLGLRMITIPDSVNLIGERAFRKCIELDSINIPNSLNEIQDQTFETCLALSSVVIPNSVTDIGNDAFKECSNLKSVIIPNSVTNIEARVFEDCESLISVVLPNQLESIEEALFQNCTRLTSVKIPNSVTRIYAAAFYNCPMLESIVLPTSLRRMGEGAFGDCSSLESINIPPSLTVIEEVAFVNCISLKTINIPNSVTVIGPNAFENCTRLTSVVIPDSVTEIVDLAFSNCSRLKSITIPGSVRYIGTDCFKDSGIEIMTIEYGEEPTEQDEPTTQTEDDDDEDTDTDDDEDTDGSDDDEDAQVDEYGDIQDMDINVLIDGARKFETDALNGMSKLHIINLVGGNPGLWRTKLGKQQFSGCDILNANARGFNVSILEYVVNARRLEQIRAKVFNKVTDSYMMEWMRGFSPKNRNLVR